MSKPFAQPNVLRNFCGAHKKNKIKLIITAKTKKHLIMEIQELLQQSFEVINAYDTMICEADTSYKTDHEIVSNEIINAEEIESGYFMTFKNTYSDSMQITTVAIVAFDGLVFVLSDWQGGYPESIDEIGDYDWICANTMQRAIMLNGMPSVLM